MEYTNAVVVAKEYFFGDLKSISGTAWERVTSIDRFKRCKKDAGVVWKSVSNRKEMRGSPSNGGFAENL